MEREAWAEKVARQAWAAKVALLRLRDRLVKVAAEPIIKPVIVMLRRHAARDAAKRITRQSIAMPRGAKVA